MLAYRSCLLAQNLVPNPGFEDYAACPGGYTQNPAEFRVDSWRSINQGSPDYFNACSEGDASVPYNWAGVSDAFEGYGYTGIFTWMNGDKDYREYLHCRLTGPLMKDSLYHIEFRYKLSSYSKYCVDRIGILLSDTLKTFSHDLVLSIKPTLSFIRDSALTENTGSWELASGDYRAKGNEQFITIGNFFNNERTHFYHIQFRAESEPMLVNSAYYYIDDVQVLPQFSQPLPEPALVADIKEAEPELNTVYVLKNIEFELDSYSLLPVSYNELDHVIGFLSNHPAIQVRLAGHTDDLGDSEYNRKLSIHRAESTASYLISKGIDENRISTFGYGESQPIVGGKNEETRQLNRRVEITFLR